MENSSSSFLTVLVIIALYYSQPSFSSQNENYDRCSEAFICGASGEITYPFFDGETRPEYCGKPGFKVGCLNRRLTQINVSTQSYFLQNINYVGHTIVVNSTQIWDSHGCPRSTSRVNYTVDYSSIVNLTSSDEVLNFYYGCTADLNLDFPAIMTNCSGSESGPWVIGYYLLERNRHRDIHDQLMGICSGYAFIPIFKSWADLIDVTIDPNSAMKSVLDALRSGFELEMVAEVGVCEACIKSGGQCGTNLGSSKFVCYCPEDKDQDFICTTHPRKGTNH